jgi:cardiolipin synthase
MDAALPQSSKLQLPNDHERINCPPGTRQGELGTSNGINTGPGNNDDGWVVPPPITLEDSTRVQLYKDGEALHAAYDAIKHAKRRICLEVYIFASDRTGRAFADLLIQKAKEGVRVYVIYDSFGSIASDRGMFEQMRRAGARVQEFHPIRPWETHFSWRPCNRDHRKLLVIDDHIAGMGGLNVGREYAGSWVIPSDDDDKCELWRDTAIGFIGPAARYFAQSFAKTWRYLQHGGRISKTAYMQGIDTTLLGKHAPRGNLLTPTIDPIRPDLSILASVATMDSPLRLLLHRLIREAKESLKLTMAYFAPDDDLVGALCGAAKRGVKVQLLLPSRYDVHAFIFAARSFYERLMSNGVEVYERQGCVLHAKTMVIDGRVSVVGSTNLDYRSIEYNCELSAVIRNPTFGKQMQDLFANDIRYAKKIELCEWERRPWRDRLVQWAVSRARYLL